MKSITEVTITKLFGYTGNDYTVKLLPEEPVTFIYGFNGIGKTTFLRLLDASLTRKLLVLNSIMFESISIKFDTGEILTVRHTILKRFEDITIGDLKDNSKDDHGYFFPFIYEWKSIDGTYLEGKYYFTNAINEWLDSISLNSIVEKEFNKNKSTWNSKTNGLKNFYTGTIIDEELSEGIIDANIEKIKVELLHANKDYCRKPIALRLKNDNGTKIKSVFENYEKMDIVSYKYDTSEDILEQRFIEINEMSDVTLREFENRARVDYDTEEKYVSFPIPDKIEYLIESLPKKADGKKINLFTEIINRKSGLTDKYISINQQGKILVIVKYKEDEFPLDIHYLSSGEKNLLLLYFQLIFDLPDSIPDNHLCLQLLDEPEVSMHPDWLLDFVDNLQYINKELGRGDNFQYVIATHSLAITYDHNEMMTQMRCING